MLTFWGKWEFWVAKTKLFSAVEKIQCIVNKYLLYTKPKSAVLLERLPFSWCPLVLTGPTGRRCCSSGFDLVVLCWGWLGAKYQVLDWIVPHSAWLENVCYFFTCEVGTIHIAPSQKYQKMKYEIIDGWCELVKWKVYS